MGWLLVLNSFGMHTNFNGVKKSTIVVFTCKTLPNAVPPIGKIHLFIKMTITFEPMIQL